MNSHPRPASSAVTSNEMKLLQFNRTFKCNIIQEYSSLHVLQNYISSRIFNWADAYDSGFYIQLGNFQSKSLNYLAEY